MYGKQITIKKLYEIAVKTNKVHMGWHHHCLHAKCIFNDTNRDLVVLEADKAYYAFVEKYDGHYKKRLEKLAYQNNKLKKIKTEKTIDQNILEKIKELDKNKSWHFHILMPECVFNKSKKYILVIENETDNVQDEFNFDNHPLELVREIDKIYLNN